MFGSTALYRKGVIFGALPKTLGMNSPNSLIFKIANASPKVQMLLCKDSRILETKMHTAKWFSFEVESDGDLRGALEWLGAAYEAAWKKP